MIYMSYSPQDAQDEILQSKYLPIPEERALYQQIRAYFDLLIEEDAK